MDEMDGGGGGGGIGQEHMSCHFLCYMHQHLLVCSWELRPGSYVLGATSWELRPESYVLGAMSWELCPGSYVLGAMSWELCPGSYILGAMSMSWELEQPLAHLLLICCRAWP